MKAGETKLESLMNCPLQQFVVPIYQRKYSWTEKQCAMLWEDIQKLSLKSSKTGHFIGSIVGFEGEIAIPGKVHEKILIDGQQRITTLSILMIAMSRTYESIGESDAASDIMEQFIINPKKIDEDKYKLLLTNQDRETYIALVEGREKDCKNPSMQLLSNFNFFIDRLENFKDAEKLNRIYMGINSLDLVYIGLNDTHDNPQLIFESMNSTGLGLSQGDLLRNYLLLGIDKSEQVRLYNSYWRSIEIEFGENGYKEKFDYFLRDYLSIFESKLIRLDSSYEEFKSFCEETGKSKEEILSSLKRYAKYYCRIILCNDKDEDLNELWKELKIQRVDVANPFLMQVYNDYESCDENVNSYLTKEDFIEIIKAINSYVFRRYICDIPTNSLNKTFAVLSNNINKQDYKNSTIAELLLLDSYKAFPDDQAFRESFIKKDIYNTRLKTYILEKIENFNHLNKIKVDNKDITIEHILPETKILKKHWQEVLGENWQELQKQYVHTIGNLTLSKRAYNSEMQDYSFNDKLAVEGGIKLSHYRLSDDICNLTKWDIEEIEKRSLKLANEALEIWKRPELTEKELKPYKNRIKHETGYEDMSHMVKMNDRIENLYKKLDEMILELDNNEISKKYAKYYVAYKYDSINFVEIIIYKNSLNILLDINFEDINDERGICEDVLHLGTWGTGDVRIRINENADIDYIMYLIKQSYDNQKNDI
jgi:uncharacterized protein with ParB-like and HNH nuclease domain